jgi:hypothetical protein
MLLNAERRPSGRARRPQSSVRPVLDQRGRLLVSALGFVGLRDAPADPTLDRLHTWLDSWSGIGHVVAGMARQGYDVELRRYDAQGWRAMFFPRSDGAIRRGFNTEDRGACWRFGPYPQRLASVTNIAQTLPLRRNRDERRLFGCGTGSLMPCSRLPPRRVLLSSPDDIPPRRD